MLGPRHAGGAGGIAQHGMSLRLAIWTRVMSWWAVDTTSYRQLWTCELVEGYHMFTRFLLPNRSTWWLRHRGFSQQMLHLERNEVLHCLRIFSKQFNLQEPHYIIFHPGINIYNLIDSPWPPPILHNPRNLHPSSKVGTGCGRALPSNMGYFGFKGFTPRLRWVFFGWWETYDTLGVLCRLPSCYNYEIIWKFQN